MSAVLTALDDEWAELAKSPRARRALRRWASTYPALAGHRDLEAVLRRRREQPASAPAILRALALLAPDDELAARTLLHAVVPGVVSLARHLVSKEPDLDLPETIDELLSLAWLRIRTYPGHRPGSVAANILYDTNKEYRRCHPQDGRLALHPSPNGGVWSKELSAEDEAMDRLILSELVTMAQRQASVSPEALALVIRTRVAETPMNAIAAERKTSTEVLTTTRWRAERQLQQLPLAG